jgi:hypothetical protein
MACIVYGGHPLAWLESVEVVTLGTGDHPTHHRFVHLTHLTVIARTVATLSRTGRLRQDALPPPLAVSAGVPAGGRPQPEPARRPAPATDPNPVALRHREIACAAIQAPPVNPLGR